MTHLKFCQEEGRVADTSNGPPSEKIVSLHSQRKEVLQRGVCMLLNGGGDLLHPALPTPQYLSLYPMQKTECSKETPIF